MAPGGGHLAMELAMEALQEAATENRSACGWGGESGGLVGWGPVPSFLKGAAGNTNGKFQHVYFKSQHIIVVQDVDK